ncbi:right-handed parallel beta-helix repeat-containing protein [Paenibacillus sp. IB182496]|uniref:Right-handed parallel beta-helix repeat-containing protein n=1 Tax=Paenibacillus sabuli TaxID=2772509 RepID=A0A927GTX8_9BACL|nr:right-handed parallel beta-helix repeat-containing protein [Paenibacillus sabuli]MBD2848088.1 right-handed parallel beta-helix repeat-containing protein [Paenibacillus sabuli]
MKKIGKLRQGTLLAAAAAIVACCPIGAPPAEAAIQATYYASPAGSGSTCSAASPCSLVGARDKVRTANDAMTGDIVVYLRGGTYDLSATLTLGSADSGTGGYAVKWTAYPGETPVLSGGRSLGGSWTLHDAAQQIYKRSGVSGEFRQLVVNGEPAVRARTPNLTDADTMGDYYTTISADTTAKTYKIHKAEISTWSDPSRVEMVVQPHWYHNRLRLDAFTTDADYAYVSFQSAESGSAFAKSASFYTGNAYHFENAYEMLDAAGEWYLDTSADTLYYKPRSGENLSTATVVAPTLDVLVQMTGMATSPVHDIAWSGVTFRHAGWSGPSSSGLVATQGASPINGLTVPGAVQAAYAERLSLESNTFELLGGTGLKLGYGLKSSQIVGNTLREIAANGIELRSPKNASDGNRSENVLIGNNTISRVGRNYSNGIGILAHFVRDTLIEHNDLYDLPYMGIQLGNQAGCNCNIGMSGNMIRYNDLHDVMQLHDDGGAIYTLGRQPGTYLYRNYIHSLAKSEYAMSYPLAGLYMDNYSEFVTAQDNVLSAIDTASGASLTYEQTGIGAQNNQWINNAAQTQSIKDNAGVQPGYTQPVIIRLADDFDDGATEDPPPGWTIGGGSGSATIADVPGSGDKSVYVAKSDAAGSTLVSRTHPATSGIVTVEARVRAEQTGGWKMAPYITDSSGTTAVSVILENGYIKTYDGPTLVNAQAFSAGTWYKLRVVLDTNTDQFDLYVDGVRRITDADFRSAVSNIAGLRLGIGAGHTGGFHFDDIKVVAP